MWNTIRLPEPPVLSVLSYCDARFVLAHRRLSVAACHRLPAETMPTETVISITPDHTQCQISYACAKVKMAVV